MSKPLIKMTVNLSGNNIEEICQQFADMMGAQFGTPIKFAVQDLRAVASSLFDARAELGTAVVDLRRAVNDAKPNHILDFEAAGGDYARVQYPEVNGAIKWIKKLRDEFPKLGLKEAKDVFESLPCNHPDVVRLVPLYHNSGLLAKASSNPPRHDIKWR